MDPAALGANALASFLYAHMRQLTSLTLRGALGIRDRFELSELRFPQLRELVAADPLQRPEQQHEAKVIASWCVFALSVLGYRYILSLSLSLRCVIH